ELRRGARLLHCRARRQPRERLGQAAPAPLRRGGAGEKGETVNNAGGRRARAAILRLARAWAALAALMLCAGGAHAAHLSGVVVDRAGKPVEFATVAVLALKLGAVPDEQG